VPVTVAASADVTALVVLDLLFSTVLSRSRARPGAAAVSSSNVPSK